MVWSQGDAAAVREQLSLGRIAPLDRLAKWWRGLQISLHPAGEIGGPGPVVRRDDHQTEEARVRLADRERRFAGDRGARDAGHVGDAEKDVQVGRARIDWVRHSLQVLPGRGVAKAPARLAVLKTVVPRGAIEVAADLGDCGSRVSYRTYLATVKQNKQRENEGQSLHGREHRRLIVRDPGGWPWADVVTN